MSVSDEDLENIQECCVEVTGFKPSTSSDTLTNCLENEKRSNGGKVIKLELDSSHKRALVWFAEKEVAARLCEGDTLKLDGAQMKICYAKDLDIQSYLISEDHSIQVKGLTTGISADALFYFLENAKKSGGGDIVISKINDDKKSAFVTFHSPKVAQRLIDKGTLTFEKKVLKICKPSFPSSCKKKPLMKVTGLKRHTSEESIINYFESRRIKGGDIEKIYHNPDERYAMILYEDEEVAERVIREGGHLQLDKAALAASLCNESIDDYIEEDEQVAQRGTEICRRKEFPSARSLPEMKPLMKVTGLKRQTSEDTIHNYFESRRIKGGEIEKMYHKPREGYAKILYKDATVAERVISKGGNLQLEKAPLSASLCYEIIDDYSEEEEQDSEEDEERSFDLATTSWAIVTGLTPDQFQEEEGRLIKKIRSKTHGYEEHFFNEETGDVLLLFESPLPADMLKFEFELDDAELIVRPLDHTYMEYAKNTACIKVENVSSDISEELLRLSLENRRFCKNCVVDECMIDSDEEAAVVSFKNPDVAQIILRKKKKLLIESHMVFFKKLTPMVYPVFVTGPFQEDKILLKGFHEDCSTAQLRSYFQENKFAVKSVTADASGGESPVVTFRKNVDYSKICELCTSKPLCGRMLGAERVPFPRTVKVITNGVSEKKLELYFENVSKSGGGSIDHITLHDDGDYAIIQFQDREVVKRLLKKQHTVSGKRLVLTEVYDEWCSLRPKKAGRTKPDLASDFQVIISEQNIASFIDFSSKARTQIKERLEAEQAEIIWPSTVKANVGISVKFPKTKRRLRGTKESWEENVSSCWDKLMDEYTYKEITIAGNIWSDFINDANFEDMKQKGKVFITTNKNAHNVTIVGETKQVKKCVDTCYSVKQDIETMRRSSEDVPLDAARFELLVKTNFSRSMESKYDNFVAVFDTNKVKFSGSQTDIDSAKTEMFHLLSEYCHAKIPLSEALIELCKIQGVVTFIQNEIEIGKINVLWKRNVSPQELHALTKNELRDALTIFSDSLVEETIRLRDTQLHIPGLDDWNTLAATLRKKHNDMLVICRTQDSKAFSLATLCYSCKDIKGEVIKFLTENSLYERSLEVPTGVLHYIKTHRERAVKNVGGSSVSKGQSLDISLDESRIIVKGRDKVIDDVIKQIGKIVDEVIMKTHEIKTPGMPKSFYQESGKSFLATLEKDEQVTIEIPESKVRQSTARSGLVVERRCHVTEGGSTIHIAKGNLTNYPVKVVVNTANPRMNHIGGLAAALANAGGPTIQQECEKYIKQKGELKTGECYKSSAGNLPYNAIIHTVGPRWKGGSHNEEKALHKSVLGCLQAASDTDSIAMPIISSGIYGYPLQESCMVIIDAICKFLSSQSSQKGNLKDIHLVDVRDSAIKCLESALINKYGKDKIVWESKRQIRSAPAAQAAPIRQGGSTDLKMSNGTRVTLVIGSILDEQTDVIVNTASKDLDLTRGILCKQLLKRAGSKIQQECANLYPNGINPGEFAVTSGGRLKCKVYHACCPQWDRGQGACERAMRKLVRNLLEKGNSDGIRSIAIPALGTGNLGHPSAIVAPMILEEINEYCQSYSNTTIQDIHIVVFNKDKDTVRVFQQNFQRQPLDTGTRQKKKTVQFDDEAETKQEGAVGGSSSPTVVVGNCTIEIKQTDITKEDTDAIVNSTNAVFGFVGPLAKAIDKAAGPALNDECKQIGSIHGGVAVTGAGRLPCSHVIHVTVDTLGGCEDAVKKALEEAAKLNLTSISLPAIGTGGRRVSVDRIAAMIMPTVVDFCKTDSKTLQRINVCIFQTSMLTAFVNALHSSLQRDAHQGERQGAIQRSHSELQVPQRLKSLTLTIYADSHPAIGRTKTRLDNFCRENSLTKTIDDPLLNNVGPLHIQFIEESARSQDVTVKMEGTTKKQIILQGNAKDLLEVYDNINKLLYHLKDEEHRKSEATAFAEQAKWCYEEDGDFKPYDSEVNALIEKAYAKKEQYAEWTGGDGDKYRITFLTMKETVKGDPCQTKVKRKSETANKSSKFRNRFLNYLFNDTKPLYIDKIELPRVWDDMRSTDGVFKRVNLGPNSQEYKDVATHFQSRVKNCTIVTIERIQNPTLYRQYVIKKQQMARPEEKTLWHGTASDCIDGINANGFNRSLCGKNATAYGKGAYFAVGSDYSCRYATKDKQQLGRMYQSKVLTGQYTQGNPSMLIPPPKDPNNVHILYDSVVDNMQNPNMFIVFTDSQCYPEYLVTFRN